MSDAVNALKLQGNTFHQQRNYTAAYQKYTEAIKLCDPEDKKTLAILYSNRAAASINLKDYLDAIQDGREATRADPTFVKGFIRAATAADAVGMLSTSAEMWKSAAEITADPVLKAECEAKANAAETARTQHQRKVEQGDYRTQMSSFRAQQIMPWMRAGRLYKQNKLAPNSSGLVILQAFHEFDQALDVLRKMKVKKEGGRDLFKPGGMVLELFTNAILTDQRVFHADFPGFFTNLEIQVKIEVQAFRGWGDTGPKDIMKEVPERLKNSSWSAVRPAVAITIRAWILRAVMESNMGRENTADEFFKRAIDILEWGRRIYANVPKSERGAIFEPTILRAVRTLRLANLLGVYRANDDHCGYTIDEIGQLAQDLKDETDASERPTSFNGQGFFAAFWIYPKAQALSVVAWAHMQRGLELTLKADEADDSEEAEAAIVASCQEFSASYKLYVEAAEAYPPDDESRPYLLAIALEALFRGHAPIRLTLPLARRVRDAIPQAKEIWEASMKSKQTTAKYDEASQFIAECERQLAKGAWTLDDCFGVAHYDVHPKTHARMHDRIEAG
ncbi:TPR-REGION domain-containing protein [Mycena chlorophos]|uniref:TPR-REGION domain-containing protein n=1 Tax=Mycena chlorophos TaxID=658473 RepID=A0A8H6SQ09_MYCCL|nr:TPR-REGION domain-containing protein [Mycena chlorophos]